MRKILGNKKYSDKQQELAKLRIMYSEDQKLLTGYVERLVGVGRVYPRHLPTQASGRWSTLDPPVTNWPRGCINPACQTHIIQERELDPFELYSNFEHEWTDMCWSVRDIFLSDSDEVLITWDHDNIEGKIHDIIVNDEAAITAHKEGFDLHTITCCDIFSYDYPFDKKNPHSSEQDKEWRKRYNWQGKDTKQRVLAKNFNHGSKYTESYKFVHRIQGIEKYGVDYGRLEQLAKRYIQSKGDAWQNKLDIMARIRSERISRTLYGFRRVFFDSSAETGREGFSHMISGTVSDYNNETLRLISCWLNDGVRLLHNAHDGDKIAVKRAVVDNTWRFEERLKRLIEREVEYEGRGLIMTAGVKVYG